MLEIIHAIMNKTIITKKANAASIQLNIITILLRRFAFCMNYWNNFVYHIVIAIRIFCTKHNFAMCKSFGKQVIIAEPFSRNSDIDLLSHHFSSFGGFGSGIQWVTFFVNV